MSLRLAAMDCLARREYSYHELYQKLSKKQGQENLMSVLESLKNEGLQSDYRYASMRVKGRSQAGYGPRFIRSELTAHHIDQDQIEKVLTDQHIDWNDLAYQAAVKKYRGDLSKIKQFLIRKGHEYDTIQCVLKELEKGADHRDS